LPKVVEIIAGTAVEVVLAAAALGLLFRIWSRFLPMPRKHRVLSFQRGILVERSGSSKVLNPGDHWVSSKRSLLLCDMRAKPFQVATQEVSMGDGMALRMSLTGEYRVADPVIFMTENSDPFGAFYLDARQALHAASRDFDGQAVLSEPFLMTARIKELLIPRAAHLGLDITQLNVSELLPIGWFRQT